MYLMLLAGAPQRLASSRALFAKVRLLNPLSKLVQPRAFSSYSSISVGIAGSIRLMPEHFHQRFIPQWLERWRFGQ